MARNKLYNPIGSFKIYDDTYDHLRMTSNILNTNRNNITETIWDKPRISAEIYNIVGDEKGMVVNSMKDLTPGKLKAVKLRLTKIEERFEAYCKTVVLQGKKRPTDLPDWLMEAKCKFDAKLSVLIEERDLLQKQLDNYVEVEQKVDMSQVLKNGPKGQGRLSNGILVEIDGMNVSINGEGIPIIDDKRAPLYHGYSAQDYFTHIVKPYNLARAVQAKENALQAKKSGLAIEGITRGNKTGSVPIPTMPTTVINYKNK